MTGLALQNETTGYFEGAVFLPATEKTFSNEWLNPSSDTNIVFNADYVMVGDKVILPPYNMTQEVEAISALADLGDILFKDARDMSTIESVALRSYYKKKYKKLSK